MRGTVYFKKWSAMPWWSRLYHIRKYSMTSESQRVGKELGPLINYLDYQFKTEVVHSGRYKIKEKKDKEVNEHEKLIEEDREYFINELFDRYPQMRGVTIFDNVDATRSQNSQLYKVVESLYRKYRNRLRSGFFRDQAFKDVVQEFQDYVDLRLVEVGRTENIANSLRAMNFVDYLKAQKIEESHYKSQQLERDSRFEEIENIVDKLKENHSIHHQIVRKNPEDLLNSTNEEMIEELLKQQIIEAKGRTAESRQTFIERSFNLLNRYYEKELMQDRLTGLTKHDILLYIRNSPTSLKKKFKPLVKFCQSHGIRLDAVGNLNITGIKDKNLLYRIKREHEKLKFALMLNDIEFGFTHKLNQKKKLNNLRKEMLSYNKEATENFNKMNEERIQQLKEAIELPLSELDKCLGFEYAEKGADIEDIKKDLNQNIYSERLTEEKFIDGKFDRIDWNDRLVDSIEERNLKLEQMWLQHRQEDVEDIDQDLNQALTDKYKRITEDLRRLKLKLDKHALEKSSKIFFNEHMSFNMDLENVPIETLDDYFKISQSLIEKNAMDLVEQRKVLQAIKPGILVKDLIPHHEPAVLAEEDTKEEFWDATRKKAVEETEIAITDENTSRLAMFMQIEGLQPKRVDDFISNVDLKENEKDLLLKMLDRRNEITGKKFDNFKLMMELRKVRQAKTKKQKNLENRERMKGK